MVCTIRRAALCASVRAPWSRRRGRFTRPPYDTVHVGPATFVIFFATPAMTIRLTAPSTYLSVFIGFQSDPCWPLAMVQRADWILYRRASRTSDVAVYSTRVWDQSCETKRNIDSTAHGIDACDGNGYLRQTSEQITQQTKRLYRKLVTPNRHYSAVLRTKDETI